MRPICFSLVFAPLVVFPQLLCASPIRTVYLHTSSHWSEPPTINNRGQIAFADGENVYVETDGALQVVAATSLPAPGLHDGEAIVAFDPYLDDRGALHLVATIRGPALPFHRGIYEFHEGQMRLVVRSGADAPGTSSGIRFPSTQEAFTSRNSLSGIGGLLIQENITGPGVHRANNMGLWTNARGPLELLVREGEPVPGADLNWVFHELKSNRQPGVLNDHGQSVFSAIIGPADDDRPSTQSIWLAEQGALRLVAKMGDRVAGYGDEVPLYELSDPTLNNSGTVAFFGQSPNGEGLFMARDGRIEPIARTGDTLSTDRNTVLRLDPDSGFSMNQWSETVFVARLQDDVAGSGLGDGALIKSAEEGLRIVARNGDQAPGLPAGVEFEYLQWAAQFTLNDSGQAAFALLHGTQPGGIWAQDPEGDLKLIAAAGQELEVSPGDFRTIQYLEINNYGSLTRTQPGWFNNFGQVVFRARFEDGSTGVFVSNAAAIPEPTALALSAFGAIFLLALHRKVSRRTLVQSH